MEKGKLGENIARKYVENKGYVVIEQNCRNKWGEIDLITRKEKELVFIEVKTRLGERFGMPEDAINKNKINRLIKNSRAYMKYKIRDNNFVYRIDTICIVLGQNNKLIRINHYENITS